MDGLIVVISTILLIIDVGFFSVGLEIEDKKLFYIFKAISIFLFIICLIFEIKYIKSRPICLFICFLGLINVGGLLTVFTIISKEKKNKKIEKYIMKIFDGKNILYDPHYIRNEIIIRFDKAYSMKVIKKTLDKMEKRFIREEKKNERKKPCKK